MAACVFVVCDTQFVIYMLVNACCMWLNIHLVAVNANDIDISLSMKFYYIFNIVCLWWGEGKYFKEMANYMGGEMISIVVRINLPKDPFM